VLEAASRSRMSQESKELAQSRLQCQTSSHPAAGPQTCLLQPRNPREVVVTAAPKNRRSDPGKARRASSLRRTWRKVGTSQSSSVMPLKSRNPSWSHKPRHLRQRAQTLEHHKKPLSPTANHKMLPDNNSRTPMARRRPPGTPPYQRVESKARTPRPTRLTPPQPPARHLSRALQRLLM